MNHKDIFFKAGLALQLILIPIAFLYHFSSEAHRYNWVLGISLVVVVLLFAWPQTILVRAKRLPAIKLQFLLVAITLSLSWVVYGLLYHYTRTHCTPAYVIQMQDDLSYSSPQWSADDYGKNCDFNPATPGIAASTVNNAILPWYLLMNPGISLQTAGLLSIVFLLFPFANYYRYSLDKGRINGIKKDDLFA